MAREIAYFFTLASPWAYLGHPTLVAIAARHGAEIRYRPMPVRRVFDETGGLPLPRRHPVRQLYRLVELQRWRERRGLPLNLRPKHPPADIGAADRCVIALVERGHDPDRFVRAVGAAIWVEDRPLDDPAAIAGLLRESGIEDAATVLDRAAGPDAVAAYEAHFAAALTNGVFGAPFYLLDGEPFWGQDRLDLLDEALATGRAPFRA